MLCMGRERTRGCGGHSFWSPRDPSPPSPLNRLGEAGYVGHLGQLQRTEEWRGSRSFFFPHFQYVFFRLLCCPTQSRVPKNCPNCEISWPWPYCYEVLLRDRSGEGAIVGDGREGLGLFCLLIRSNTTCCWQWVGTVQVPYRPLVEAAGSLDLCQARSTQVGSLLLPVEFF
jgi:hypothetical protein